MDDVYAIQVWRNDPKLSEKEDWRWACGYEERPAGRFSVSGFRMNLYPSIEKAMEEIRVVETWLSEEQPQRVPDRVRIVRLTPDSDVEMVAATAVNFAGAIVLLVKRVMFWKALALISTAALAGWIGAWIW